MRGRLRVEPRLGEAERVLVLYGEEVDVKGRRIGPSALDPTLASAPLDDLNGMDVDYDLNTKKRVRNVRPRGTAATERAVEAATPQAQISPGPPARIRNDVFHNPYTFIPTPDRPTDGPLADGPPPDHDRLLPDRWTGRIRVRMVTETPLLILDRARPTDIPGHNEYDPLVDADGSPSIPPTSVKGMLRSAYEAVTNSRFGVFEGHDEPLPYRMDASEGLRMVPARVSANGRGLELLAGTTPVGMRPRPDPMYAAWLRCYPKPGVPAGYKHGSPVRVLLELVQHQRWDDRAGRYKPDFKYWAVRGLCGPSDTPRLSAALSANESASHRPSGTTRIADGWLCITNRNIKRKHDERVFFVDGAPTKVELTPDLRERWDLLMRSYRDVHSDKELFERPLAAGDPTRYIGPDPGSTAWSPHIYEGRHPAFPSGRERLHPGALVYAKLDGSKNVIGLFPVMISRDLFPVAPRDLLPEEFHPAVSLAELSPADRVFGWVRGKDSYRGNLRVGPVTCAEGAASIRRFEHQSVPLAILGQPRPQQGRFYVGTADHRGAKPLESQLPKPDLYSAQRRALRGRKAYPHHASLPADHWADADVDRTGVLSAGHYQEFRRAGGEKDNQNRSITGWIEPRTTFAFDIDVKNLLPEELGALLWILDDLPVGHVLRLGLGKPLGFGSVIVGLDWANTRLALGGVVPDPGAGTTPSWASWWSDLRATEPPSMDRSGIARTIDDFQTATAHGEPFTSAPHIKAFLATASGDPTIRVHYPRVRPKPAHPREAVAPSADAQAYQWFVANERQADGRVMAGRGLSLPPPGDDGLPIHPGR